MCMGSMGSDCFTGVWFPFGVMTRFQIQVEVVTVPCCEYTRCTLSCSFKRVNCVKCYLISTKLQFFNFSFYIREKLINNVVLVSGVHQSDSAIHIRSDQISCSVMSDSLRPHESQHARPPCPSPTPGVHPDSRPSSQ